jgi:hypothetical protein
LISAAVPARIEYTAEVIPPGDTNSKDLQRVLDASRLCGVRMQWPTSEPSTYYEKRGYPRRPTASLDNRLPAQAPRGRQAVLDTGFVRYQVTSKSKSLVLKEDDSAAYSAAWCVPIKERGGRLLASCLLEITGRSQFQMPLISPRTATS